MNKALRFVDYSFLLADLKEEYKELLSKQAERLKLIS